MAASETNLQNEPAFVPSVSLVTTAQRGDSSTPLAFAQPFSSSFVGSRVGRRRVPAGLLNYPVVLSTKDLRHVPKWTMQIVDEAEIMKTRSHEVFMPALSSTMTEGKIVQWLKSEGEFVAKGEMVMVVESDKADMDVESFDEGYVATILVKEGDTAPVGSTVALLAEKKEDIEDVKRCGLDCVISGAGSRHDGTTAVEAKHMPDTPLAIPLEDSKSSPVEGSNGVYDSASSTATIAKPDFEEVFMPALSSTMSEGKIVDWLKSEGDKIEQGENIMVVESDKADMDVEAFESGFLAHVMLDAGNSAKVGEAVAFIAKTKEDIPKVKEWAQSQASTSQDTEPVTSSNPAPPDATKLPQKQELSVAPVVNTGRIIASPYAKKTAKEIGVDLARVRGTGPNGRIVQKDVLAAKEGATGPESASKNGAVRKVVATPGAEKAAKKEKIDLAKVQGTGNFGRITEEDVLRAAGKLEEPKKKSETPLEVAPTQATRKNVTTTTAPIPEGAVTMSGLQKAVVKTMNTSLTVPVFRVSYSIDTTAFDELYAKVKSKGVTVSALLAKAVSLALKKHPIMNARYENEAVVYNKDINIAMALSLPDGGLITPVLRRADSKDLYSLSREWKSLVKKALEKKLSPEDYNSGTFCVSNLGMFGVESFDAILPPNSGAILAVAASKPKVVVQKNGMIGSQKEMKVTITCDHRHIYGAKTAEFLRDLADIIENDATSLVM